MGQRSVISAGLCVPSGLVIVTEERNKSNDYFESLQYRQDLCQIAPYHKRKHFPSYTRCSENHNNTCAENRKIRGLKFDTLYWRHLAAYSKKLNIGAQLHIIPYNKPPKHFWKLHSLIDFRCAQTLALPCAFGTRLQFDSFIVAPCKAVAKYFYTGAHLQYMG